MVSYVAYTAKYLTYLLKSTEVIQIWEFDNLHMTQCAKIGFMANVGNVFYPTFTNVFFILSTFFTFFNVFFNFHLNVYTSMHQTTKCGIASALNSAETSETKTVLRMAGISCGILALRRPKFYLHSSMHIHTTIFIQFITIPGMHHDNNVS